jgi:transcriptional regulator with XRE-family HTH domain
MMMCERIRQFIKENGMTLTHVSKKSSIKLQKISRIVRGEQTLTIDDYESICRALNVEPGFFYNEKFLKSKNISA